MKIIISHDVDHLYLSDHFLDTFLAGTFIRSIKALSNRDITFNEMRNRFSLQLNNIKELHQFNKSYGVKETFFFGMRKGLNLSYHWRKSRKYIDYLLEENVLIGLHGMAFDSYELLIEEKERLQSMLPGNYFLGIRNHYLRNIDNTFKLMDKAGFLYDSTTYNLSFPKKIKNMWQIPITIMDAGYISKEINQQDLHTKTIQKVRDAEDLNLPFIVINFHDIYFSDGYPNFKEWYQWLIRWFKENNYEYISFKNAVDILSFR